MSLYPGPWLRKPDALAAIWRLVSSTALHELGLVGYLSAGEPVWVPPSSGARLAQVGQHLTDTAYTAEGTLDDAFEHLSGIRRSLPAGTFVFVCSDFLSPPEPAWWARALAYRWDVVPVTGRTHAVRLRRGEAEERRRENEARLASLRAELRGLALEPIVIGNAAESEVLEALTDWGETRLAVRRGEW